MLVWTNKSGYGKHCGRKDIAADNVSVHHVQEVVDVIESKIKPCILFTRSQSQQGRFRRLRILCSRMTQSCNYKDSSYNGFRQRDVYFMHHTQLVSTCNAAYPCQIITVYTSTVIIIIMYK